MGPNSKRDILAKKEEKIYLPSFALNILPKIIAVSFLILAFIAFIDFLQGNDWSPRALGQLFVLIGIIVTVFFLFWKASYVLLKRYAGFVFVKNGKLVLQRKQISQEYALDSIDHFLITSTVCFAASGNLAKRELFIIDTQENKRRVHHNDMANNLKKSWKKFGSQLEDRTGTKVKFIDYVEDLDGQIFELSEYQDKQFEGRVKLFENPYK